MASKDLKKQEIINVSVQFGDIKVQYSGEPENVASSVMNFLSKNIPEIGLARKISLNYSISELIRSLFSYNQNYTRRTKNIAR